MSKRSNGGAIWYTGMSSWDSAVIYSIVLSGVAIIVFLIICCIQ